MFFYASLSGFVESRVVGKKGQTLSADARTLLGEAAWSSIANEALRGAPVVLKKQGLASQTASLFGPNAFARHESKTLADCVGSPGSERNPSRL